MNTIFENSTGKELAEGYFNIASQLIEKVRRVNPTAKVIKTGKMNLTEVLSLD